jgi:hypothetical protein
MAAVIVVALAIFIGIVLFAGRRPYIKRGAKPPRTTPGREPAWPETPSSRQ